MDEHIFEEHMATNEEPNEALTYKLQDAETGKLGLAKVEFPRSVGARIVSGIKSKPWTFALGLAAVSTAAAVATVLLSQSRQRKTPAPKASRGPSARGLDGRARDTDGEIRKKRTDTLVGSLREEYGTQFAKGFAPDTELDTVLKESGVKTLDQYLKQNGSRQPAKRRSLKKSATKLT